MNLYALIVAGGSGQRMQSQVPKQFLELAGKPILMHTIEKFYRFNPQIQITVVLPEVHIQNWQELIEKHRFNIQHSLVSGGDVRFVSVLNGLNSIQGTGLVAIHDGVRPLVSFDVIKRCFNKALECGNAIPAIPVYESVRKIENDSSIMVDRSLYKLIQTPQVFDLNLIRKAYQQPYKSEFTDDASVLENMNEKIQMVEGNRENIKITDPLDLIIAEAFIKAENK
jgi:2-C-methyl-D-erythritol 4-phosphate cytidylyltransferase